MGAPQSRVRGVQVEVAAAVGTRGRPAGRQHADRRVHRRRRGRPGPRLHAGVPHPGDLEAAGTSRRGPAVVPQARGGTDQLSRQVQARVRGVRGAEGLLPRPDREAQVEADRGHHRRSGRRRDRWREAQRRSHLLLPATAAARGPGNHLPVVGKPAVPVAHPSRTVPRGAGRSRAHRSRHRGRACGSRRR